MVNLILNSTNTKGCMSNSTRVTSGVHPQTVLGPLLSLLYILKSVFAILSVILRAFTSHPGEVEHLDL